MLQSQPSEPEDVPNDELSGINKVDADQSDILLIGHVTCDLETADRNSAYRLGGTVSFAAVTAMRLGRTPTVVTRAAPSTDLSALPNGLDLYVLPSPVTTTFANIYTEQGRIQYCYEQALPISAADIPPILHNPRAVLLGPLVNEITSDVASIFDDTTFVAAVPQGWMRQWDESGRVSAKPWQNSEAILPHLSVLVLSLEDIGQDLRRMEPWFEQVGVIVLTEYRDGSTIFQRQDDGSIRQSKIPPRTAREIDPTGAGDVFATAFVIRMQETDDPLHAARFANIAASFSVEHPGVTGVPTREEVLAYMEAYPVDFETVDYVLS